METKFYNDGVTIISITTIILGCLVMSLKILFKSKCKDVNVCFGLLKIKHAKPYYLVYYQFLYHFLIQPYVLFSIIQSKH